MDSQNLEITSWKMPESDWKVGMLVVDDSDETLAFVELEPLEAQLFASLLATEGEKVMRRNEDQGMFETDTSD